jgi:hypothetical protein
VRNHDIGHLSYKCTSCKAIFWLGEKVRGTTLHVCCSNGKVVLPPLQYTPLLKELLEDQNDTGKEFRQNIRGYNSSLAFTSIGVNIDRNLLQNTTGSYTFRIHGMFYHRIGSLIPNGGQPKFAQIYIYDTANELSNRHANINSVNITTLLRLQNMINEVNPYAREFKAVSKRITQDISMIIRADVPGIDRRRYNRPVDTDVAVIMPGDGYQFESTRDIIISKTDETLHRISELHSAYDPLQYVLLFPFGELGWSPNIPYTGNINSRQHVTQMEYYSYRLQIRDEYSILHRSGRLFHQYIVDNYAKIESNRLNFIRLHQKEVRADLYAGLEDAIINGETDASRIGRRIVLPSSFINGPRHMNQLFQDSMAIVREYGKPDLFITFTCNPNWGEIKRAPSGTKTNRQTRPNHESF